MFRKLKKEPTLYVFNNVEYKESQIPEIFRYNNPEVPEDCTFIISPSQIGTFFSCPKVWYYENMLKEKKNVPNSSMILGTICHYIYDSVAKGKAVNKDLINEQLDEYLDILADPSINGDYIKSMYPVVTAMVVNTYILGRNNDSSVKTEVKGYAKVKNGIYVAGTCDRIESNTIVDYKTVKSKPNSNDPIPFYYEIQLLAYWYIFTSLGYSIDTCRLVYGILPTKTIDTRVETPEFTVDYPKEKLIRDTLYLMADTIQTALDNPAITYLLFKSYDLKELK